MGEMTKERGYRELEDLYRARRDSLVKLAVLLIGSHALAEEAVHDAFLGIVAPLREGHVENPYAYLRRVVVNECRQRQRRVAVEERYLPEPPTPALPPEEDAMWELVMRLSPRRRTAIVLRYYEDLSIEQIAAAMNCRPGTVSSLLHRALTALRKELR